MTEAAKILLALGSVLLLGVATDAIGRRTPLPRVSLLLIFGFLIGPGYLDLLPGAFIDSFDLTAENIEWPFMVMFFSSLGNGTGGIQPHASIPGNAIAGRDQFNRLF